MTFATMKNLQLGFPLHQSRFLYVYTYKRNIWKVERLQSAEQPEAFSSTDNSTICLTLKRSKNHSFPLCKIQYKFLSNSPDNILLWWSMQ